MRRTVSTPEIAYELGGTPGAPRVLLVMGFGMRGNVWRPQIEGLGAELELAWFDNRGIGESAADATWFRMGDLAADALRVADALGWDDFHLVGVSLGGMIAQEVAFTAPNRLRSLTLVATHPGGRLGILPTAQGLYHWLSAVFGPAKARVTHLTRLLYPASFLAEVDATVLRQRMQVQVGTPPPRATSVRQIRAILGHDTRARLPTLRTPTLVVKPTGDLLIRPLHSDVLAAGIPGARKLELPGAGHGLTFHAAAEVNRAILEHVRAHDRAPALP